MSKSYQYYFDVNFLRALVSHLTDDRNALIVFDQLDIADDVSTSIRTLEFLIAVLDG